MGTIYEDVAALQQAVETLQSDMITANNNITVLQSDISGMQMVTLTEGADLHELAVGDYLIPDATVCATLLNKPDGVGNSTGRVLVRAGGNEGQKTVYYIPCVKTSPSYYQQSYYQSEWGSWNCVNLFDSGWIDLPLNDGISAYSEAQKPRYRRIGKEVFLSGVFTGVTASNTNIATLPNGYRPSKKVIFAVAAVGQIISRISIDTDGTIAYNRSTIEPIVAENYHSIACNFNAD